MLPISSTIRARISASTEHPQLKVHMLLPRQKQDTNVTLVGHKAGPPSPQQYCIPQLKTVSSTQTCNIVQKACAAPTHPARSQAASCIAKNYTQSSSCCCLHPRSSRGLLTSLPNAAAPVNRRECKRTANTHHLTHNRGYTPGQDGKDTTR